MKRFIIFTYGILYAILSTAQIVTIEDATAIAYKYVEKSTIFANSPRDKYANILSAKNLAKTISISGVTPLYIVQLDDGWVLVSSDSVAKPILAASPTGTFPSMEKMPDAMKWLLSFYENSIRFAQDSIKYKCSHPEWHSISTCTSTEMPNTLETEQQSTTLPDSAKLSRIDMVLWNQHGNNDSSTPFCSNVYNKFCPNWYSLHCGRTLVGCTAVAMGIVMWYYQWPTYAYIPNNIDTLGNISLETHLVLYNWDNMFPQLDNSTLDYNVNSVAGLLRDCGYASRMKYEQDGSFATLTDAKNALNTIFQFQNVYYQQRFNSTNRWIKKMKSEIAAGRPIIYEGYGTNGGHAMVIYGYKENKFNINWGWGGNSNNGLYSLDPLDPTPSPNGPYDSYQAALFGIEPKLECNGKTFSGNQSQDILFAVHGGEIVLSNYIISSGQEGYYYSNDYIRITTGFHAKAGSEVHIAIRNVPCNDISYEPQRITPKTPSDDTDPIYETSTYNSIENIEYTNIISTSIYNVSGQLIQTISGGQHDAAHLPNGMYILQHRMSDGNIKNEKIINCN
jgi:hypothetical protein